jgi:hypothetical protein
MLNIAMSIINTAMSNNPGHLDQISAWTNVYPNLTHHTLIRS